MHSFMAGPRQMGVGGLGLGCSSTPHSLPGNCNIVVQEPAVRQVGISVTALPFILSATWEATPPSGSEAGALLPGLSWG